MDNELIMRYILSCDAIELPSVQRKFNLSYSEIKTLADFMVKSKMIEYVSGVSYNVLAKKPDAQKKREPVFEDDPIKIFYKKALWRCVKRGTASIAALQRDMGVGFNKAGNAVEWMEKKGYVLPLPSRETVMTEYEYRRKFGNPDNPFKADDELYTDALDGQDLKKNEELRAAVANIYTQLDDDDDDDILLDDDDDDCDLETLLASLADDDEDDEDICVSDDAKTAKAADDTVVNAVDGAVDADDEEARVKSFLDSIEEEKRRLLKSANVRRMLIECLSLGLKEKTGDDGYVVEIDGQGVFDLKFVDGGNSLKISDGGRTLAQSYLSARKTNNVLKNYASVAFDGQEISATIQNPLDAFKTILTLYSAVDAVKRAK